MPASNVKQENTSIEQVLKIHQQIAFASGLFQGDITIRTLLESLAEGVVIIDNTGTILLVNARAEQMFGYPAKELVGKPHSDLIPERFRRVHEDHQAHFFAEPSIRPMGQRLDLTGRRQDGSEFPLEISLSFIETINGIFAMAFISDITLRKKYESHLQESEEMFRLQVENVKDYAIFMLDAQGKVLNWNVGSEFLTGYRDEEIIGREFSCFYPDEERDAGKAEEELKKAAAEGRVEVEGWRVRKDGGRFWADTIMTALRDENGNLGGFSSVTRDITERKLAQEEREKLLVELDAVLNSITEGVVISDLEGNVLEMNPAALAIHEFKSVEQARMHLHQYPRTFELTCLDGHPLPVKEWPLARALRGERFTNYEVRVRRKDTGKIWVGSYSSTPVQFKQGDISLAVLTLSDITERKLAEEVLRKTEMKFSKVFHSVPALLAISTLAEGRCIEVNETSLRTLGYRREEVVGKTTQELGMWGSKAARSRFIHSLEKQGTVHNLEITFSGKNGKPFIGLLSAEFVEFNDNRYILSMVSDITERNRMEMEIKRLNDELAARAAELEIANQELEAYNYTIAHDLRTPLNVIGSYSQVVMGTCGEQLDETCKHYVKEITKSVFRMSGLINTLLEFSKVKHAKAKNDIVDLSIIAQAIALELKIAEPYRKVSFEIEEGLTVKGDKLLLRVVLENLIGNAWKYSSKKEETLIEFGKTIYKKEPAFFVRDNGEGFAMIDADKLFTPFQRASKEHAGHGIGLATVHRIIKHHNGKIWAEGEPGKGATFYFTL